MPEKALSKQQLREQARQRLAALPDQRSDADGAIVNQLVMLCTSLGADAPLAAFMAIRGEPDISALLRRRLRYPQARHLPPPHPPFGKPAAPSDKKATYGYLLNL